MPAPLFLTERSPALSFVYLAVFVIATALRTYNDTTIATIATILGMSVRKIAPRLVSPFLRSNAPVTLVFCASGMVFQTLLSTPVDLGSMASFAMGIPLLCAWAGVHRWSAPSRSNV